MSNSKNKCGWLFGLTDTMRPMQGKSPYEHIFDSGRSRGKKDLSANEILAREGGQNSLNQPVDNTLDTHIRFTLIYLDGDNKKDFKNKIIFLYKNNKLKIYSLVTILLIVLFSSNHKRKDFLIQVHPNFFLSSYDLLRLNL